MKTVITFLIVFGVIVLIHEFGHFYFARKSGILVREFSIGMGPKIYAHQGKDGTAYTVRMLPVGGYVRMAGVEEDDTTLTPGMPLAIMLNENNQVVKINLSKKIQLPNSVPLELTKHDLVDALEISGFVMGDETEEMTYTVCHDATIIEENGVEVRIAPRDVQFQSAKLWQRMLTNFAGPMNNFILSLVIFIAIAFLRGGVPDNQHQEVAIGEIVADSVAEKAGFQTGDQILTIDGKAINTGDEAIEIISAHPEEEVAFEVLRDDQKQTIKVAPKKEKVDGQTVGRLGVGITTMAKITKASVGEKIIWGAKETGNQILSIFDSLKSLVKRFNINQLGGPVMMFQLSAQASEGGAMTVLLLMGWLSISLGIMNLLPIPGLDGGKLLLNIIEGLRGKPLSQEKEGIITLIGVGCMVLLMLAVTWNDIQRFLFR
ncbi:regulator of sigma E protease [Enterococcus sp. PF1-24]|uniref:RIP metalloprotease RseP n=1 Tax=unclassified Enterococcus TaxID=2608891 RepID=UPI002475D037|nr:MULTISPECIES: RIP metalloprotease RseP [unclassified Enterococcus]MDH6364953.1 regulator of sigma E protease [Enterococcus sp. PFB1-1]MDH6402054.1 regulator of sigma E protease [Enterococcus sp. PF1-24]